ncbi:MAG: DUF4091 domain-containing protein [Oscillospiraceae bacterium]|nr:DUF4091 domain-containing protein [Oscillospiraceae bacterium]
MKRILTFCLALVMMLSLCVACKDEAQTEAQTNQGDVKLWYAYNTENFMQDVEYPEVMAERDSTLRMQCLRNDVESIQLMITPTYNVVEYDFQMKDLKNKAGDVLAADTFEFFAEYYTEITESYNMDSYYGFYPDALVPLANYKDSHYNYISAGMNQGLWIHANIPEDQAAGVYTGSGKLILDGKSYDIPFEVTVYEASIPQENNIRTAIAIWYEYIARGEGYYSPELGEAYYDFLVSKRISPLKAEDILWTMSNVDGYVDWVVEQTKNPMVSNYTLPYDVDMYELGRIVRRESVMTMLSAMAEKNIELRKAGDETIDLFQKASYYLGAVCDEPSGQRVQVAKDCDLIIYQCKREVAEKYFKDQYPDLYESCMKVPHIVTSAYNPEVAGDDTTGGVQTWCGQFQSWHTEAQRQNYYDRRDNSGREYGENLWWYGCESPHAPFPNFHMDDDTIATRIIPWMMFDYDVEGMIYWCVSYYATADIYQYPSVYLNAVGDGQLVYPGAKFGIYGPISSRRLENIREGFEDYECLLMIEKNILAYNEANGTDHDPKEIMGWIYADLYEGTIPERDNAAGFAEQRTAMLEILELFTTDAEAAMDALLDG